MNKTRLTAQQMSQTLLGAWRTGVVSHGSVFRVPEKETEAGKEKRRSKREGGRGREGEKHPDSRSSVQSREGGTGSVQPSPRVRFAPSRIFVAGRVPGSLLSLGRRRHTEGCHLFSPTPGHFHNHRPRAPLCILLRETYFPAGRTKEGESPAP